MTGDWRKFRNEKLHVMYLPPNIIRLMTSRRTGWVGHMARMGNKRYTYVVFKGIT